MLLLVGCEKGGTGKTTMAANLAAMCSLAGHETLLVDTDLQGSASAWASVRVELGVKPAILCVTKTGRVGHDLAGLKMKFNRIVVDAGGRDGVELRQSMAVADKVLMPMRPSQFDTWSLSTMAQLLRDLEERLGSRPPAHVLLNAVSTNVRSTEAREIREALADYADLMPALETQVAERAGFRRAAREGRALVEMPIVDAKGAREMIDLYEEVFGEPFHNAA